MYHHFAANAFRSNAVIFLRALNARLMRFRVSVPQCFVTSSKNGWNMYGRAEAPHTFGLILMDCMQQQHYYFD